DRDYVVVGSVDQEAGRSLEGDIFLAGERRNEFRGWMLAEKVSPRSGMTERSHRNDGVDQDAEVRAATYPIYRIRRVRLAVVEVGYCRRSQMPAGGESENADPGWIDAESICIRTHISDRSIDVAQHDRMVILGSEAVPEDKSFDSHRLHIFRDGHSLMV